MNGQPEGERRGYDVNGVDIDEGDADNTIDGKIRGMSPRAVDGVRGCRGVSNDNLRTGRRERIDEPALKGLAQF